MQKRLEKWRGIAAALVTIVGFPLLLALRTAQGRKGTLDPPGDSGKGR